MDVILERLARAERPLQWVGGNQWTDTGLAALVQLAERWHLPVVTSFRRKDHFPNHHAAYAGALEAARAHDGPRCCTSSRSSSTAPPAAA